MRTRVIYIAAAVLAAASLSLPLWGFTMSAPQYPDESLHLQIVRTGIAGDVHEVTTLQKYIGVRFPTDIPELRWASGAIVGLAAAFVLAAFAGASRWARAYRALCATAMLAFLIASASAVQLRLYHVGHDRDPHAPIRAVHSFTPPLVGPVKVANFTVWSYPQSGAALLLAAAILSIVGVRARSAGSSHDNGARILGAGFTKAVA